MVLRTLRILSLSSQEAEGGAEGVVSDGGKVLNINVWNTELIDRVKALYPGYEEVDATHGKIGDVEVVWNITPTDDNAYQKNLDTALDNQGNASDDEKVDIFLVEADNALKYINTDYTLSMKDIGISDEDLANQYDYTKEIAKDKDCVIKASSWQACPGVVFYNREAAKKVLGTDDTEKVQEYISDWDKFNETAGKMKKEGYTMTSSALDSYRVYSNNVSTKCVVDGKITVDDNLMKWVEDSKKLYDAGETGVHALWSDDWSKGFYPDGKVFCYFGPAWLVNFCMAADKDGSIANKGGWGASAGPQGFFWGGTWICAANGTDNSELAKDIILKLTADDATMEQIVTKFNDFANNKTVMEKLAKDDKAGAMDVLGGQNALPIFSQGIDSIDLSNLSEYDSGFNIDFQAAITDYLKGNCTLDEAMNTFKTAMKERYPELEE